MVQCSRIVPPSGGRSAHVVRRRLSPCRGLRLPARMKVKPMKTSDLIEQRAAIVARMNAAHTADDDAAFQTAETELRNLDTKLERQRKLDAADRSEPGTPINGDGNLAHELPPPLSVSRPLADAAGLPSDDRR